MNALKAYTIIRGTSIASPPEAGPYGHSYSLYMSLCACICKYHTFSATDPAGVVESLTHFKETGPQVVETESP